MGSICGLPVEQIPTYFSILDEDSQPLRIAQAPITVMNEPKSHKPRSKLIANKPSGIYFVIKKYPLR